MVTYIFRKMAMRPRGGVLAVYEPCELAEIGSATVSDLGVNSVCAGSVVWIARPNVAIEKMVAHDELFEFSPIFLRNGSSKYVDVSMAVKMIAYSKTGQNVDCVHVVLILY